MSAARNPRQLPSQWRPRERLLRYGAETLSEQELWICILGMGRPGKPVQLLSRWVLNQKDPSVAPLPSQLYEQELGRSQAARVLAVRELQRRWRRYQPLRVRSVEDVLLVVADLWKAQQEQIICLYLSATNELLHTERIALGTLNAALLYPRDLFFPIRLHPVASLILCHNHPSGNPEPSNEDRIFTKRVEAACEILGIALYDHVIVAKEGHFSFQEGGLLNVKNE